MSYSFDAATQAMRGHYVEFTDGRGEYRTMPSDGCVAGVHSVPA